MNTDEKRCAVAVYVAAPRLTTASSSPSALQLQFPSDAATFTSSNNYHHCHKPSTPQVSIPRSRRLLRQQHTLLQRSAKYNSNTDGNIASSSSSSSDFSKDDDDDHGFDPSRWVTMGGGVDGGDHNHQRIHIEDSGHEVHDHYINDDNEGGGGEGSFKASLAADILHSLMGARNGGGGDDQVRNNIPPQQNNTNLSAIGGGDVAVITSLFGASGTGKSSLYFGAVRGGDGGDTSGGGPGVVDMVIHSLLHPDTTPSNPTATACPSTSWKPSSKASVPRAAGQTIVSSSAALPPKSGHIRGVMTPAQQAAENLKKLIQEDKVHLRRAWHQTANNTNGSLHHLSVANLRAASPDAPAAGGRAPSTPQPPAVDVLLSVVESRPMMLRVPVPCGGSRTTALLNQSCGSNISVGAIGSSWEWDTRVVMVNIDLVSGNADLEAIAKSLVRELGGDNDDDDTDRHSVDVRGVFCSINSQAFIAGPHSSSTPTTTDVGELASALLPVPSNSNPSSSSSPHYLLCSTSEDFSNSLTACLARSGSWCVPGGGGGGRNHDRSHTNYHGSSYASRGDSDVLEVPASTIAGGVETVLSALRGHLSSTTPPLSPSSKTAAASSSGGDMTMVDGLVPKLQDGDVLTPSATGTKSSIVLTIALRSQGKTSSTPSSSDKFAVWKIFDLAGPPVGRFHHTPATSSATNTYNHIVRYYRTLHHLLPSSSSMVHNNRRTTASGGGGFASSSSSALFYNIGVPLTNSQFGYSSSATQLMLHQHRSSAPSTPSASQQYGGGISPSSRGGGRRRSSVSFGGGVNDSMALSEGGWSVINTSMMGAGGSVFEGSNNGIGMGGGKGAPHRSFHCPVAASLIYLLNATNNSSTPSISVFTSLLCCLRQDGLFDHSNRLSLLVAKTAEEQYQHRHATISSVSSTRNNRRESPSTSGGGNVSSLLGVRYAALVQYTLAFQDSTTTPASTRVSTPFPSPSSFMWSRAESLIKAAVHASQRTSGRSPPDMCTVRVPGDSVKHWPPSLLYAVGRPVRPSSTSPSTTSFSSLNKSVPFFDLTFPRKILLDLLCSSNGGTGVAGPPRQVVVVAHPTPSSSSSRPTTKSRGNYNNLLDQQQPNIPSIFTQQSDTEPFYELLSLLLLTKTYSHHHLSQSDKDDANNIDHRGSIRKVEDAPFHLPFVQGALEHHIATLMPTLSSGNLGKRSPPRLHIGALQSAVSAYSNRMPSQSTSPLTKQYPQPLNNTKDVSPSASQQSDLAPPSSVSMGNASSRSGGRRVSIDVPSPPASPRQVLLKGFTTASTSRGAAAESMEYDGTGGLTSSSATNTTVTNIKRTVVSTNLLTSRKASATTTTSQSRSPNYHRPDDLVQVGGGHGRSDDDDDGDTTSGSMSDRPHDKEDDADCEDMDEPTGIDAEEEDYPSDWDEESSSVAASGGGGVGGGSNVSESERAIRAEQAALLKHLLEPSYNGPLPGIDDEDSDTNSGEGSSHHHRFTTTRSSESRHVVGDADVDEEEEKEDGGYEDDYEEEDVHDGAGGADRNSNVISNSSTDTTAPTTLEETMPSASSRVALAASRDRPHTTRTTPTAGNKNSQQHNNQRPSWLVGLDVAMQSVRAGASQPTKPTTNHTTTFLRGGVESSCLSPTRSKSTSKKSNDAANTSLTTPSVSNTSDRLHRTETASTAPKRLSARIHGRNAAQVAAAAAAQHPNGGATTLSASAAIRGGGSYASADYCTDTRPSADSLHLGPHDILDNVAYVKGVLAEASRLDDEDEDGEDISVSDGGSDENNNNKTSHNGTSLLHHAPPSTIYPLSSSSAINHSNNTSTKITSSSKSRQTSGKTKTQSDLEREVHRLRRELNNALTENERCMRFMEVDVAGPLIDYYERATSNIDEDDGVVAPYTNDASSSSVNNNNHSSHHHQRSTLSVLRKGGSYHHNQPPSRRLEDTLEVIRSIGSKCMSQAEGSRMLLSTSRATTSNRTYQQYNQPQHQRSSRHATSILMDGSGYNNSRRGVGGGSGYSSVNGSYEEVNGTVRSRHNQSTNTSRHSASNNITHSSLTAANRQQYYDTEALSRRDEYSLHPHYDTYRNEEGNGTNATGTFRKVLNSSGVMYQRASVATKESSRRHAEAISEVERLLRENSRLVKMVSGQDVLCRGLKDQLSAANDRNAALAARLHNDTSAGLIADLFTSACDSSVGGRGANGGSVVSVTGPPLRGHHGLQAGDGATSDGGLMLARALQGSVHGVFRYVEDVFDTVVDQLQRRSDGQQHPSYSTRHSNSGGVRASTSRSPVVMTEGQVEALLRTVLSAKEEFKASIVPGVVESMEDVQRELVSATTREQQYLHMVLQ